MGIPTSDQMINPDISEWVIKDAMNQDDDGNVVEDDDPVDTKTDDDNDGDTDGKSDESDELETQDSEGDKDAKPKDDEPLTQDKVNDETEFDIDGQKVTLGEAFKAYRDRRDQQADYTRKTQVHADNVRNWENERKEYESAWEKRGTDPNEMLLYLKRRHPDTLHQVAVMYGTEYSEMQELAKENPQEYDRLRREERAKLDKINNEEKNKLAYRKEVQRIRNLLENHVEPALESAEILPKRRGKGYEKYILGEFHAMYMEHMRTHPGEQVTKETIHKIAKKLKDDKGVLEELEHDQARYKQKDAKKNGKKETKPKSSTKPKPKITKVNEDRPTRKEQKESITHENFFDKIV